SKNEIKRERPGTGSKSARSLLDLSIVNTSSSGQAVAPGPMANAGTVDDHHFSTGHLLADLKSRTISSGFITISAQGAKFVLTVAPTVILARLLNPQDFGLVAIVTAVTGFFRVFKDAGLSTATVQRDSITHAQVSNLFWINVAVGGLISLVIAAMAPGLAVFYH